MIVHCEKCGTKYKLDDSKVKPEGIKVRCSKCQHLFKVSPAPFLDEEDIFGEKEARAEGPSVKEWEEEFTTKPPPEQIETMPPTLEEAAPPEAFFPPSAPEERVSREEGAVEEGPSLDEELSPFLAHIREVPPEKKPKVLKTFLLSILLIVVIFAALYYYFNKELYSPYYDSIHKKVYRLMGEKGENKLLLLYPKRYELTIEGEKIFVIHGKVANNSQEAKKYVKLKGSLFNKEGTVVATSIGYCGYAITKEKIQQSTYASLKSSFGFVSRAKAAPVPGQQSPSFTIIFFSPPAGVTECKVEIVEAPPLT